MPPTFVPDLFERFTRSEELGRPLPAGTGLGLAIARSYARAHGGELVYEDATRTAPASCWSCPRSRAATRPTPRG